MNKRIIVNVVFAMSFLFQFSLFAQDISGFNKDIEIEGQYRVKGKNSDGSEYSGICTISYLEGIEYVFVWSLGEKGRFQANAELAGDKITIHTQPSPAVYAIKEGGKVIEGTWANGTAGETMIRIPLDPQTGRACSTGLLHDNRFKDTDGDLVFDGFDKCPDTPKGTVVDSVGCAITKKSD